MSTDRLNRGNIGASCVLPARRPARLLAVAVGFAASPLGEASTIEGIQQESGSAYDPEAVRAFMRALPKAALPRKEREVLIAELQPGMVLAKGICSRHRSFLGNSSASAPFRHRLWDGTDSAL